MIDFPKDGDKVTSPVPVSYSGNADSVTAIFTPGGVSTGLTGNAAKTTWTGSVPLPSGSKSGDKVRLTVTASPGGVFQVDCVVN